MVFEKKMNQLKKLVFFLKGKVYKVPYGAISSSNGSNLKIGKNVSFGGNVMLYGNSEITIGDNSMIAYGVIMHTSTHDYNQHPMNSKIINRPIKVGNHTWIGTAAIILPGVVIEDFAVIGAGSIVTANVPKGAIVVGNPARIIKYRDNIENVSNDDINELCIEVVKGDYMANDKICKRNNF